MHLRFQLFAVFGSFAGSLVVIAIFANEIVSVLTTFGIVLNCSRTILATTILAYGTNFGDLISNVTIARKGYSKMGFTACFAGPMFSWEQFYAINIKICTKVLLSSDTLVGIGLILLIKVHRSEGGVTNVRHGAIGPNGIIFLIFLLLATTVYLLLTKYQAGRCLGCLMLSIYFLFLLYALLAELNVIHPYGTDHNSEVV